MATHTHPATDPAMQGLHVVDRSKYAEFLHHLGKNDVKCRIDTGRSIVITEYSLNQVVVARSVCRQTPLGRIVEASYGILQDSNPT